MSTTLIIPTLTAAHAVEIRKLLLPNGQRQTESLMNDGTRRLIHTWRDAHGETQFDARDVAEDAWLHPEADYLSIDRRNPRTGDWDRIR